MCVAEVDQRFADHPKDHSTADLELDLGLRTDDLLECSKCAQEFTWHDGPGRGRPDDWNEPPVHWSPLCGQASEHDQFFTQAQVELIRETAVAAQPSEIDEAMKRAVRGSRSMTYRSGGNHPEPPDPLTEPDDMDQLASPCHPWEPVKVPTASTPPYFCLACGETFTV